MANGINPSLTIAIPAFCEEETIEEVSSEALKEAKKVTSDYELLLVNDGSTDKTGKLMDKLRRSNNHIRVIHHKKNMGFTGAIKTSLFEGKKELVFLAPADGQFDFRQLKKFVYAIEGYDVAVAYRVINAEPFVRKFLSRGYHLLSGLILGIHLKEFSTVSMWRLDALKNLKIVSDPRSAMALPEIIHRAIKKGYKFNQVPISWYKRKGGVAKGKGNLRFYLSTFVGMIKIWWKVREDV